MAIGKPIGNMVIELGLDSAAFSRNLKGAKQAVRNATSEMKNNFKIIDSGGNKLEAMKSKQSGLTKVIEAQENEVAELTKAYKDSFDAQGNATAKTADLARKTNDAKGKLAAYKAQLEQTNIQLREIQSKTIAAGKKMEAFGNSMQKVGKQMSSVGKNMITKVTLPIAGIATAAIKTGITFSSSMSKVGAISGATGKDLEELEDKAREMGAKTSKSASEAADAMGYMALAGWDNKQMLEGIQPILSLSEAGNLDLARASDLVTDSMSAMGIQVKDLDTYLDKVAKTSNRANTDIDALMEAYVIAGGSLKGLNVPLEESAALLGVMANRGFKGSEAGTALNAIIARIANTTGPASKAFKEMGIKVFDSKGQFRGMETVLSEVQKKMAGMNDAQKAQIKTQIAGLNHGKTFDAMISGLGEEYGDLKNDIVNSDDALKNMRDTMQDNLQGDIAQATSALSELGLKIFDVLEPSVRMVTQRFTEFVGKLQELSPKQIEAAVKFAGIAAAIGPVLWIGGKLIGTFGSMFNTLGGGLVTIGQFIARAGSLSGALKGFGAVIAGPAGIAALIGVLIAGIVAAYVKFDWFREKVDAVFKFILDKVVKPIMGAMSDFFGEQLAKITSFWNENSEQIKQAVSNFTNFIQPVINFAMKAIEFVIKMVWGNVKGIITGALDVIMGAVKIFTAIFTGDWKMLWDGIKQVVSGAIKVVWNWINLMFIGKILKGIGGLASGAKSLVSGMWQGIKNFFSGGISGAVSSTAGFIGRIKGFFSGMKSSLINAVKSMWQGIKNFFSGGTRNASSNTSGFVDKIRQYFSVMKFKLIYTVKAMWLNIKSLFFDSISNVVGRVKEMPGLMAKNIRKGGGALKDAFVAIWKTAVKGVAAPANKIIGGANWILDKFGSKNKIAKWEPYAKGTDGHKGGHALVNDQKGPNYREAVQLPNGNTFIPEGRNVLLPDLPKGSKVLPATQTKALYRYKNGVGKWASGIWNGVKKGAKKVKDTALDVFEYISNPSKLVDKVISNFVDYDGLGGIALSMGKGLIGKVTGSMKSWVANFIEKEVGDPGGGGGGPINFGGLVRTSKYGWRTHPITGKRKLHGGVDFGGGQGIGHPIKAQVGGKVVHAGRAGTFGNMVKLHQGIYDYVYAHLSKILVKNGQSIAAGKLIGLMGSTGASTGPHVHYEIRKNGKRIDPEKASVGKQTTGGNVNRWRGTVMKALSMNGLPTTPAYVNAWLRQIETESGGNPRAVQGNIGDINNRTGDLAKGLVQVIGSTFRAYSFKGHKNRFNPLDSLLAGINYAKSRYGIVGMLRKIGHGHGYANGGLVRNHQIAEIAEGNKPEMVIPLTKKARAVQLIQKAQDILGMNEEYQVSQQNNQNVELYRLMNDQNKLLRALLEKESNIYMDSEKVGRATAPTIDRINGRNIVFAEGRVLK